MFGKDWDDYFRATYGDDAVKWVTNGEISEVIIDGNRFTIGSNVENHLTSSSFVRDKGKGIVGGHDFDSFLNELEKQGDLDKCIVKITPHPEKEGIFEIKYQVPALETDYVNGGTKIKLDSDGNIVYKPIKEPKTVYDPKMYSSAQMAQWGKEAMQNAHLTGSRIIEGTASNGLVFRGYVDLTTGEITNFFPTLK